MHASLAPNSRNTYRSGWRSYVYFCNSNFLPVVPVTQQNLIYFCTYSANRQLTHGSILIYLTAIKYFSQTLGYPFTTTEMHGLFHLLRGIRRIQGNSLTRPKRQPITLNHLRTLRYHYFTHHVADHAMLWCASTMAFFGLLRSSEYCAPGPSSHIDSTLMIQDVQFSFNRSSLSIRIKASKTDPFRQGITIRLFKINSPFCPVEAAIAYVDRRSHTHGPFFQFSNATYLTRSSMASILHEVFYPSVTINTHSFRIGGASAAASAGLPDSVIQTLGRWSSDCFRLYIRASTQDLRRYQESMAIARSAKLWDKDRLSSN